MKSTMFKIMHTKAVWPRLDSFARRLADQRDRLALVRWLEAERVSLLLDVGANRGQFAHDVRVHGYRGRIVSWEPQSAVFAELEVAAGGDSRWTVRRAALGAQPGVGAIRISGNDGVSSSFLPMTDEHMDAAPGSAYVGTEEVAVETLDQVLPSLADSGELAGLKIDSQGFELEILQGALDSLARIPVIYTELLTGQLYEDQAEMDAVLAFLRKQAYSIASIVPDYIDPRSGRPLAFNATFLRRNDR